MKRQVIVDLLAEPNQLSLYRMKFYRIEQKSDWIGIISSVGCIVHCLAMPLIIYVTGAVLDRGKYEWLDYIFVGLAAIAVVFSVRQSHVRTVKLLLLLAWLLFAVSVIVQPVFANAYLFMYVGSVALIAGHAINIRHCRQSKMHKHQVAV